MSIKVMTMVWDHYPAGGGELLTALKYADHAHDDGSGIRPSVAYIAKKTRQSERTIQMHLAAMRKATWLLTVRYAEGGRGRATEYRINPQWISNPANFAPFLRTVERVQPDARKGADDDVKGCKSFAPQPPGTVIEPTTTTALMAESSVVMVDSSLNFHGLFDGDVAASAQRLLARCPPRYRQEVIDEVAGCALEGELRKAPIRLLRSLIERVHAGAFEPERAFSFREHQSRQEKERERMRLERERHEAARSPANLEASREAREAALARLSWLRPKRPTSSESNP